MGAARYDSLAQYAGYAPVAGNIAMIAGLMLVPAKYLKAPMKKSLAVGAVIALVDSVVQSFATGRSYLGGGGIEPLQAALPEGMGSYGVYERALGANYVTALPGGIHEYVSDSGVGEYVSDSGMGEYVADSGMGSFEIVGDQGDLGQSTFGVEEAMAGVGDNGILGGSIF
jgi:hypothetical protein